MTRHGGQGLLAPEKLTEHVETLDDYAPDIGRVCRR